MGNVFAWEMWAVLAAAPCFIAWLIGSLHGEARTRRALGLPDLSVSRAGLPLAAAPSPSDRATQRDAGREREQSAPVTADDVSAQQAAQLPDQDGSISVLEELREQTENFRMSARLWDDPEVLRELLEPDPVADQVLSHYRGSICTLERANAKRQRRDHGDIWSEAGNLSESQKDVRETDASWISDIDMKSGHVVLSNREPWYDGEDSENQAHLTVRRA